MGLAQREEEHDILRGAGVGADRGKGAGINCVIDSPPKPERGGGAVVGTAGCCTGGGGATVDTVSCFWGAEGYTSEAISSRARGSQAPAGAGPPAVIETFLRFKSSQKCRLGIYTGRCGNHPVFDGNHGSQYWKNKGEKVLTSPQPPT